MSDLGRLTRVDLRDIWETEAQDFTPWLAREENLTFLGETLGIDLELEAVEKNVGPFRADILCQNTSTSDWVLIENQLERTDHTHLGQLITYAAGLEAVTIIWIAARVADEHRAACDWLNDVTGTDIRFFALEVELWRIGEGPAAPKFNIVSKPNYWSRNAASAKKAIEAGALSPTRQMQRDYWSEVENRIADLGGPINPVSPLPQSWLNHGIGKSGVSLGFSMKTRDKWVRAGINLGALWGKSDFSELQTRHDAIKQDFAGELDWQELPEKRESRVCVTLADADPFDISDWPRQHQWLVDNALRLHRAFAHRVRALVRNRSTTEETAQ
ncbi:MAG: DUF4268 domain-containing protein [Rhodobacteraceae bacterium]|nr:DUF4268 domain-containing protein [Paracoccaceae bacterium]